MKRQWLSTTEVNRVYNDVLNFRNSLSSPIPYQRTTNADGTVTMIFQPGHFSADVRFDIWRVDGGFDIENDGHPEDVVMWGNDSRGGGTCGVDEAHSASYSGLILARDGYTVDRKRTKAIFEREDVPGLQGHFPIGASMGLFKYREKAYFATFLDKPLTAAELADAEKLAHTLAVFSRQNHRTIRICEYLANDQGNQ